MNTTNKSLIKFLSKNNDTLFYNWSFHDFVRLFEKDYNDILKDIKLCQDNIANPKEWKDLCDSNSKLLYNTVEEYIADEKKCLADYKRDLAEIESTQKDFKQDFSDYMSDTSYDWNIEVANAKAWYENYDLPEKKYNEIKENMSDDGMFYCTICDNYFIVKNTCDGNINTNICPCCGVVSEDAIKPITYHSII